MQIADLQKLSLIDYPGKLSCTIFLFGCNFKCGFCHNPELVLPEKAIVGYKEEDVLNFLKSRKKYLDGVCITGGEPLINKSLPEFLDKVKRIGYKIKIDTNGSNPELLKLIIEKGLVDYIALDVKIDKENYDILCGKEVNLKDIEKSMEIILDSGLNYEFRTTVIRSYHNIEVFKKIGKWIFSTRNSKPRKFYIQNFIPREGKLIDEKFEKIQSFDDKELEEMKNAVSEYFEDVIIRK